MTIDNSMNIHRIKSVKTETEDFVTASGHEFTLSRYRFTDTEGNMFTVNAFLAKEEEK